MRVQKIFLNFGLYFIRLRARPCTPFCLEYIFALSLIIAGFILFRGKKVTTPSLLLLRYSMHLAATLSSSVTMALILGPAATSSAREYFLSTLARFPTVL